MELNMNDSLEGKTIHIIGIGGTGMSPIALVLKEMGVDVRGSDRAESVYTKRLSESGIPVTIGQKAEAVKGADIVVYSSAVHSDNPELSAAVEAGIPIKKRFEFLDYMLSDRKVIAISGTHGKTTTTSMTAWTLNELGLAPGFIIGSISRDLGTNARAGTGEQFVIEADEYDRMFLGLHPFIGVITRMEYDHPDCYPTVTEYVQAFRDFLSNIRPGGIALLNADDPNQTDLWNDAPQARKISFGLKQAADYQAAALRKNDHGGHDFIFTDSADPTVRIPVSLSVPGEYNVANALVTMSICALEGANLEKAADALGRFSGIARRFEQIADWNDIRVIDDYAHHPTEIAATLKAAREVFDDRRIWAVWQPHTFSRTKQLLDNFCGAFHDADRLVVTNIYAARETETDFGMKDLKQAMCHPNVFFPGTVAQTASFLANPVSGLKSGDVVVTLSAGDANQAGTKALEIMKKRQEFRESAVFQSCRDSFLKEEPLSKYAFTGCGGLARYFIIVHDRETLINAIRTADGMGIPCRVFGGMSNVLISDAGYDGLVILNRVDDFEIGDETEDSVLLHVDVGIPMAKLVQKLESLSLSGMEWAAGLPGTLGGAIYGNAGAFGKTISETLDAVSILNDVFSMETLPCDELRFAYRSSGLKTHTMNGTILSAALRMRKMDSSLIKTEIERNRAFRKEKQPVGERSLGSVFKNPANDSAGALIERAGLKGKTIGGVTVSQKHANFFVVEEGGNSTDYMTLINYVRQTVKERFGVMLDLEIELVGFSE